MSSETLVEGPNGVLAAWESKGQVFWGRVDPATGGVSRAVSPAGATNNRKHPTLAVNRSGEVLLAWTEGTGWQRGGALVWQLYDASGRPTPEAGRLEGGIPVWGLPSAVARPDGGFLLFH
jgi:hypothetical protein